MTVNDLPALNATLNSVSALLITLGYVAIRRARPAAMMVVTGKDGALGTANQRWIAMHKICMLSAVAVSAVFLVSYLTLHFIKGSTSFPEEYPIARIVYLLILTSHATLAVVVTPMVLVTSYLGLRDRLARHVRLARWTLPIWLYVSVTGVVVYLMLYQLFRPV